MESCQSLHRGIDNWRVTVPAFLCVRPEVTCITSVLSLWAKISHMALVNSKGGWEMWREHMEYLVCLTLPRELVL